MNKNIEWVNAYKLACAFGHEWCRAIPGGMAQATQSILRGGKAYVMQKWEEYENSDLRSRWPGISPGLDHTTYSGRLEWDCEGPLVHLTINRPQGESIIVEVVTGENRLPETKILFINFDPEDALAEERHFDAINDAITALGGAPIDAAEYTAAYDNAPKYESPETFEFDDVQRGFDDMMDRESLKRSQTRYR